MRRHSLYGGGGGGGLDPRTVAYLTATGITDTTIANAINTKILAKDAAGLTSLDICDYPMKGGTYATCSYNLVNPAKNQLSYYYPYGNTLTVDAYGMACTDSGNFADTGCYLTDLPLNSVYYAFYSRTNDFTAPQIEMGVGDVNTYSWLAIVWDSRTWYGINDGGAALNYTPSTTLGCWAISRIASNLTILYHNGIEVARNTDASTRSQVATIWLFNAWGRRNCAWGSTKQCANAKVGYGHTAQQALDDYTIEQAFQTALGANV